MLRDSGTRTRTPAHSRPPRAGPETTPCVGTLQPVTQWRVLVPLSAGLMRAVTDRAGANSVQNDNFALSWAGCATIGTVSARACIAAISPGGVRAAALAGTSNAQTIAKLKQDPPALLCQIEVCGT